MRGWRDSGVKCRWKEEDEMEGNDSSEVKPVFHKTLIFSAPLASLKPQSEETKEQKLCFTSQLPAMLCKYTKSRLLGGPVHMEMFRVLYKPSAFYTRPGSRVWGMQSN